MSDLTADKIIDAMNETAAAQLARITALEAENAQLRAERDGARAAMAKEAADQCHLDKYSKTIDTFVFNGDMAKNRSGDTEFLSLTEVNRIIGQMQSAILTFATVPPGYVCANVEVPQGLLPQKPQDDPHDGPCCYELVDNRWIGIGCTCGNSGDTANASYWAKSMNDWLDAVDLFKKHGTDITTITKATP